MIAPEIAMGPELWARFSSKFMPEPNSGCWLWFGASHEAGYGRIRVRATRRNEPAHRLMFECVHGVSLPSDLLVCHRCDTPACVNPDHLFVGDIGDNNRDSVAKGRNATGERAGGATLTDAEAATVAAAEGKYSVIAARFGISVQHVSQLKQGLCRKTIGRRLQSKPGFFRKLSPDQVRAIRADTRLYREIAEAFGVCLNSVYNIKAGRTYAVLPGEDAA